MADVSGNLAPHFASTPIHIARACRTVLLLMAKHHFENKLQIDLYSREVEGAQLLCKTDGLQHNRRGVDHVKMNLLERLFTWRESDHNDT